MRIKYFSVLINLFLMSIFFYKNSIAIRLNHVLIFLEIVSKDLTFQWPHFILLNSKTFDHGTGVFFSIASLNIIFTFS